ncbi:MAG TPA: hypothetical protein VGV57_04385, partial [Thermoleophilaceae bacterium]|nr:hypothetical protein [Thermoleophilaceae bacterium]
YTPSLASSVWVGYPNARREMRGVHGVEVAGGTFPAQIWGSYMKAVKGPTCRNFDRPSEPVRFKPFFGRRSRGRSSGTSRSDGRGYSAPQLGILGREDAYGGRNYSGGDTPTPSRGYTPTPSRTYEGPSSSGGSDGGGSFGDGGSSDGGGGGSDGAAPDF